MITNPGDDPNQAAGKPSIRMEQVNAISKQLVIPMADGMSAAIMMFVRTNRININPGTKCEAPLHEFVLRLVQEINDGPDKDKDGELHPYPFKDSLKEPILSAITDIIPHAVTLLALGAKDELEKICRVVGAGETIKFLDEHRVEAIKVIAEIRGDDIVKLDDSSPVK